MCMNTCENESIHYTIITYDTSGNMSENLTLNEILYHQNNISGQNKIRSL